MRAALRPLLREALALVRSWWQVDRIRVSPREGRLLTLKPPCVVFVGDRPVEVMGRALSDQPTAPRVTYACRTAAGPAELCVRLTNDRELEITWREDNREQALAECDVLDPPAVRATIPVGPCPASSIQTQVLEQAQKKAR